MKHATQLQLSMHADVALPASEAVVVSEHLETCPSCLARFAEIKDEAGFIRSTLQIEARENTGEVTVPKFSAPSGLRGFALANLATGLVIWLTQFLWKTLFGEVIVNASTWVTSIYLPDIYAMSSATLLYLLKEGTVMFNAYLGFVVLSLFTATTLWYLLMHRKTRVTMNICLVVFVMGAMVFPAPVNALEVRMEEDVVTIAASETVDDTLLIAAETILIEGVIKGDLMVAGRRVVISGTVEGNLITFADTITISGKVGGMALGASSTYDLRGATVGGDLWVAGEQIGIDSESSVVRNASVASRSANIDGSVGKDLYAFAETVEFSGSLGEDLEAFANRMRLLGDAHVAGNVRFRTDSEDGLHRADSVRVDGEVEFLDMPQELEEGSKYAKIKYYLWQAARLIGAFLVGMAFLWLVPGLRSMSIGADVDTLKTAAIGLVTVVSVPIAAVLVAVTLVGLPISFMAIAAWLLGLYLAKIVVGAVIGQLLLSESDSLPRTLFVGLLIVLIAVNLPFIGGILNLVLTIVGLGMLVQFLIGTLPGREHRDYEEI